MSGQQPFDLAEARAAANAASRRQTDVEQQLRDASKALAETERAYREALSKRSVELHAEGTAWSAVDSIARGQKPVSDLRYVRDVARGVLDAAQQAAYRVGADRRTLETLCQWSMRRELAEGGHTAEPVKQHRPIGATA